jgi:cell division transport system ATP-binding protein
VNNIIEAKDIYLAYNSQANVIKNASFIMKEGEVIIITGVSGSGKSTLMRALYGDLKILNGSLKVIGNELSEISKTKLRTIRQNIGIVFQDYKLINEYSVEDNVALPLSIQGYKSSFCKKQAKNLLAHVNLGLKAKKYPLELSGGEQQRVGVARAISHNPKIILADEPTGNLDEYSSSIIWDLFQKASKELSACVVVVTHTLPGELYDCHYRRLHLEDGVLNEVY